MNWYLITLQPARADMLTGGPTEEESAAVGRHFAYLQALQQKGQIYLAGRTLDDGPDTLGIAVVRAASDADAQELLAQDPAIQAGVFRGQVRPYGVAVGGWPDVDQN